MQQSRIRNLPPPTELFIDTAKRILSTYYDVRYKFEYLQLVKTSRFRPNQSHGPYYNVVNGGANHWKISFSIREPFERQTLEELQSYFLDFMIPKYFMFRGSYMEYIASRDQNFYVVEIRVRK